VRSLVNSGAKIGKNTSYLLQLFLSCQIQNKTQIILFTCCDEKTNWTLKKDNTLNVDSKCDDIDLIVVILNVHTAKTRL
jgi:hypothetical protein